jgi:tetratricopeptide (TPR) repeat protein
MFSLRRAAALVVTLMALAATGQALAQEKVSPKLAKPLKAAQEAIAKKQYDQALAKLDEADAMGGKSAYDQFIINEFRGSVYLPQRKYAEAARVYEANLASGKMPPEDVNSRLKVLVQLHTATKNYPRVIEFGDRLVKSGAADIDTRVLVAQAHYLQKGYKNAISGIQGAIKASEQAGKAPDENWLQLLRSSQQNLGDTAGAAQTLEKMVRLYPKTEYWDFLLSTRMREKGITDRVQLNLLRLASQVGVMDEADEYIELTEMLLEAGLPGEAKSVMEAGFQAKAFETPDKARADRYLRRLNDAKAAAAKDQQALPVIEKDAQKAQTGQGDVALGMAYSSFGQYDKAAAALAQGLQKGGVRDPEQAQIMLGIANLKLGKKDEALKAFEQVKGADPKMTEVARLWSIYARSSAA